MQIAFSALYSLVEPSSETEQFSAILSFSSDFSDGFPARTEYESGAQRRSRSSPIRGAAMNGLHSAPPDPRMHRAPRHVPFRVGHFVVSSRDCVEFDSSTSVRKSRRVKRPRVDPLGAVVRITHGRIVTRTSRICARFRAISLPPVASRAVVSRISLHARERVRANVRANE